MKAIQWRSYNESYKEGNTNEGHTMSLIKKAIQWISYNDGHTMRVL